MTVQCEACCENAANIELFDVKPEKASTGKFTIFCLVAVRLATDLC